MDDLKENLTPNPASNGPASEQMVDEMLDNEIVLPLLAPSATVVALCALNVVFFPLLPFTCCGGIRIVKVKEEAVLLSLGKYQGTLRKPGCYCVNPCCLDVRSVSTAQVAHHLQNVKVADAKGNPLLLSGVVTYRVVNAQKAALNVTSYSSFINTQGLTVMKKVAALYPYEAKAGEHSLKSEAGELRLKLIELLQERVNEAGIQVLNFEFNDLAYSPEIAQVMLVRQQAEAVVDARKLIAEGAVEIVKETILGMESQGLAMSDQEKIRMASNLVVAICSENGASPVMTVNS